MFFVCDRPRVQSRFLSSPIECLKNVDINCDLVPVEPRFTFFVICFSSFFQSGGTGRFRARFCQFMGRFWIGIGLSCGGELGFTFELQILTLIGCRHV